MRILGVKILGGENFRGENFRGGARILRGEAGSMIAKNT